LDNPVKKGSDVHQARLRFLSLWVSQTLRVLFGLVLANFCCLEWAQTGYGNEFGLASGDRLFSILPFIVLARSTAFSVMTFPVAGSWSAQPAFAF